MLYNKLLFFTYCVLSIQALAEECCDHKQVGEYNYTLSEKDTKVGFEHGCLNGCIYYRDDTGPQGKRWCFNRGTSIPKCLDSNTNATTGK